ncbi:hypothetical protein AA0475_2102 [Acetobacter peroxydans]|nr:hypothetical protein AA13755_0166 [Acetobacter peroxydans NBRC 13755]GBR44246.1 hypothetical protein AA0475_2102 [Acetobacter peroxydans]
MRALTQRVEADESEVRVMGSKSTLLGTLAAGWEGKFGGEGGIRTLGTIARTTVFETAPFDRSGTSPWVGLIRTV